MMDAKTKTKWVKALRSGRYRQGRGQLENTKNGTFCCLGVLCKVRRIPTDSEPDQDGYLPKKLHGLLQWRTQQELVDRNDAKKHNFEQIADYVERNL